MELLNFSLRDSPTTITLVEGEREWELHNYAVLQSAEYRPMEDTLILTWGLGDFPRPGNISPWGDANNHHKRCRISFEGVSYFEVLSEASGSDENADLSFMAWVTTCPSGVQVPAELRVSEGKPEEPRHLLLKMQSGRTIEIGAKTAMLMPIG